MGKTSYNFKMNFYKLLTLCICGYPLTNEYGVMGASLCYLILSITGLVVWKVEIYRLLRFTISDIMKLILLPSMCTFFAIISVLCLPLVFAISSVGAFVGAIALGISAYISVGTIAERTFGANFLQSVFDTFRILKADYGAKEGNA